MRTRLAIAALLMFGFTASLAAQTDSVDVTFFYKPTKTVTRVFVPGEFNGWGPNNSGVIAAGAPSEMSFDAASGRWYKTVRLRVGGPQTGGGVAGAYQYKFNENGTNTGWLPDPLNPRQNPSDNNNSILYVTSPTIHYLLPNAVSGAVNTLQPEITAYIFSTRTAAVDTGSLNLAIDGTSYSGLGSAYDPVTNFFSYVPIEPLSVGEHKLKLFARSSSGSQSSDSTTFVVNPAVTVEELPAGVVDGINYIDATTVTLSLYAPHKSSVYVIGDFNNWKVDTAYFLKRTPDSSRYWITLTGLAPTKEYIFQYLVDGKLKIADPYTEKVSDPWNDQWISTSTYPNLLPYPTGKTQEIASILQTEQTPYVWEASDYQRQASENLVIYELLIRDFVSKHDYSTLIDTLDYLQTLGVNAIELMPVMEFEGNESWGYNVDFYFAPDKYYGPKHDLQRFIDTCHKRGIAVILDIVLNHSFGQSPFVRLYSSGTYGPPTPDNPWFNVTATHPYSVGFDFNHESPMTKALVDRVNAFWLQEYHVDGFRFDLSKGFTQTQSGSDVNLWSNYDASRIAILKRMADKIWVIDPNAFVILEHFAENREEQELANYGMMLWGKMTDPYNEATMGYHDNGKSDLAWGSYKARGWSKPQLVTYMESHDEERLMYKNVTYGNQSGGYNVKDTTTALNRMKAAAAFFFTIPGPKMIWQFGELGYDYSINFNGRVGNKPIRWDYLRDQRRRNLRQVFVALIKLKTTNAAFKSTNYALAVRDAVKRINITDNSMNVAVIGNFDVVVRSINPNFQNQGMWYDYFSGESLQVTNTQQTISLSPGEFHIYTTVKLETPEPGIVTVVADRSIPLPRQLALYPNYPNPFNPETTLEFDLPASARVQIKIFDLLGREIATLLDRQMVPGPHRVVWNARDADGQLSPSGIYLVRLQVGTAVAVRKITLMK